MGLGFPTALQAMLQESQEPPRSDRVAASLVVSPRKVRSHVEGARLFEWKNLPGSSRESRAYGRDCHSAALRDSAGP